MGTIQSFSSITLYMINIEALLPVTPYLGMTTNKDLQDAQYITISDARFRFRNRNRLRNQPHFCWNQNWNRNQRFQNVLESEPELESENWVLESESESGISNLVLSSSLEFELLDHYLKPWHGIDRLESESEPECRFLGSNRNWNGISGLLAGIGIGTGIRLLNFPGIGTGINM